MTVRPGVVVVSGHMVDTPDRPQPRFPPERVPRVAGEVQSALERWDVGPGTTLVTGGARGADIVAAEAARARGARLRLVLACRPDDFVKDSVALPGTDWKERFYALLGQADVEVVPARTTRMSTSARTTGSSRPRARSTIDRTPSSCGTVTRATVPAARATSPCGWGAPQPSNASSSSTGPTPESSDPARRVPPFTPARPA